MSGPFTESPAPILPPHFQSIADNSTVLHDPSFSLFTDDIRVAQHILHVARDTPEGQPLVIPAPALLHALNLPAVISCLDLVPEALQRLMSTVIVLEQGSGFPEFRGKLLTSFKWTPSSTEAHSSVTVQLNPRLVLEYSLT